MANRRSISKSISISRRLAKVSQLSALLFTWMIPHTDDGGNIAGDPETVKALVMPARPETVDQINGCIDELVKIELLAQYMIANDRFLHMNKWEEHQTLRLDRPSFIYPAYPLATTRQPNGNHSAAELNRTELNRTEKNTTYAAQFEELWKMYPRKVSKPTAYRSWKKEKISAELHKKMMDALKNHLESDQWTRDEGRYIPHPTTWLNQRRWEGMLPKAKPAEKKPYYLGDPIIKKFGKRFVRLKDGRELEFAGKEKDIEWR